MVKQGYDLHIVHMAILLKRKTMSINHTATIFIDFTTLWLTDKYTSHLATKLGLISAVT